MAWAPTFHLTGLGRGRDAGQPDDRGRLVQAFLPFGFGIGVGGDPAADAQHGATVGSEFDGADGDVQLASRDRGCQTDCAAVYSATAMLPLRNQLARSVFGSSGY